MISQGPSRTLDKNVVEYLQLRFWWGQQLDKYIALEEAMKNHCFAFLFVSNKTFVMFPHHNHNIIKGFILSLFELI